MKWFDVSVANIGNVNKLLQERNAKLHTRAYLISVCEAACPDLHRSGCSFTHALKTRSHPPAYLPLPWCWTLFSSLNVTHHSYQRWSRSLKPRVSRQGELCSNPSPPACPCLLNVINHHVRSIIVTDTDRKEDVVFDGVKRVASPCLLGGCWKCGTDLTNFWWFEFSKRHNAMSTLEQV